MQQPHCKYTVCRLESVIYACASQSLIRLIVAQDLYTPRPGSSRLSMRVSTVTFVSVLFYCRSLVWLWVGFNARWVTHVSEEQLISEKTYICIGNRLLICSSYWNQTLAVAAVREEQFRRKIIPINARGSWRKLNNHDDDDAVMRVIMTRVYRLYLSMDGACYLKKLASSCNYTASCYALFLVRCASSLFLYIPRWLIIIQIT